MYGNSYKAFKITLLSGSMKSELLQSHFTITVSPFFQQFGSAGGTSVKKIIKKSFFSMIILVMSTCTHYQKNKASLLVTSRQLGGITKSVWNHSKLPD